VAAAPVWPTAGSALCRETSKEVAALGFSDGRHPLSGDITRVDARGWLDLKERERSAAVSIAWSNRVTVCRILVANAPSQGRSPRSTQVCRGDRPTTRGAPWRRQTDEGVRRSTRQSRPLAEKAAAVLPEAAQSAGLLSDGPKPVVRRQARAVGGWMTARWSGVSTNAQRKRVVRKDPDSYAGGFPTANERDSKSGASASARNANVGCRNGFEASWRCAQAEPRGKASRSVEQGESSSAWTRSIIVLRAEGCPGHATSESSARAPRSCAD
jgi:hypothetical protein